jgi:hypothetical protein
LRGECAIGIGRIKCSDDAVRQVDVLIWDGRIIFEFFFALVELPEELVALIGCDEIVDFWGESPGEVGLEGFVYIGGAAKVAYG